MVKGKWSTVNGQRSTVNGQRSTVNGQRSTVNGTECYHSRRPKTNLQTHLHRLDLSPCHPLILSS
ncbi:MAG: hypothetical protein KDE24_08775, partial [Caldilinea sp.]|nr:hypothetical protein [Caldilinea sp.]